MNEKEIKKITDSVDGFLHDEEGKLLYKLAQKCTGKGVIVEIGSWKGKSTIWLGQGSKKGKYIKIFAIDPHTGSSEHKNKQKKVWTYTEFKKNIKNGMVDDIVIPIIKTSIQAAKSFKYPIELIFIDGAHEYKFVKRDFELWFPKVIEGGIIAFHDTTNWPGPKKVVEEYIYKSSLCKNTGFVKSITYTQKVQMNFFKDRLKNRYILFLKELYSTTSTLPLPKVIKHWGRILIRNLQ